MLTDVCVVASLTMYLETAFKLVQCRLDHEAAYKLAVFTSKLMVNTCTGCVVCNCFLIQLCMHGYCNGRKKNMYTVIFLVGATFNAAVLLVPQLFKEESNLLFIVDRVSMRALIKTRFVNFL
jgi:uncharacterized membrane protein